MLPCTIVRTLSVLTTAVIHALPELPQVSSILIVKLSIFYCTNILPSYFTAQTQTFHTHHAWTFSSSHPSTPQRQRRQKVWSTRQQGGLKRRPPHFPPLHLVLVPTLFEGSMQVDSSSSTPFAMAHHSITITRSTSPAPFEHHMPEDKVVIASSTMEKRPSSIFVEHLEDATPTQEDMEVCVSDDPCSMTLKLADTLVQSRVHFFSTHI